MQCINLKERFGDRYRITFDPAYAPRNVPRNKLDPWMMLLEFKGGNIYPHGGDILAVEVEGRRFLRKRLAGISGLTPKQHGDDFQAWTFHMDHFAAVAEIVKPHRRPTLTDDQRAKKRERMKSLRSQLQIKRENGGDQTCEKAVV